MGALVLGVVGVPRLDMHGPLHFLGVMDPLCGATRATYFMAHAEWALAWAYNPGVFVLAFVSVFGVVRWIVGLASGWWATKRVPRRLAWSLVIAGLIALEINQQAHAALLVRR